MGRKFGECCPIFGPMTHFRLKPKVFVKSWFTPHSNRIRKVEAGKSADFYLLTTNFRFKAEITGKTGSISKVAVRPRIRRAMAYLLMKVLRTIPWKCSLPVLSPENRLDRKVPENSQLTPQCRSGPLQFRRPLARRLWLCPWCTWPTPRRLRLVFWRLWALCRHPWAGRGTAGPISLKLTIFDKIGFSAVIFERGWAGKSCCNGRWRLGPDC